MLVALSSLMEGRKRLTVSSYPVISYPSPVLQRVGFSIHLQSLIFASLWSTSCIGTCLIYVMPSNLPPLDPRHVWPMTMNELRVQVDDIINLCMVHGDHGWPPQSGGSSVAAKGTILLNISAIIGKYNIEIDYRFRYFEWPPAKRNIWCTQL